MAQFNWKYLSDRGAQYNVGLFHGNRTGHVLIHCNSRIVTIDFSVYQTKKYSFFIEDELCEINLEKQGNKFIYDFEVNRKVDTPLNRIRNEIEKKHWKQSLLFFGGLGLCVFLFVLWFFSMGGGQQEQTRQELIDQLHTSETFGKITINNQKAIYSFVANGRVYKADVPIESVLQTKEGMPLETGDEFLVKFAPLKPEINEIDLSLPSKSQIEKYYNRTLSRHISLHPELTLDLIKCQIKIAYEMNGIAGLADFLFQDVDPEQNPAHNRLSYQRFVRDLPFKALVAEQCW